MTTKLVCVSCALLVLAGCGPDDALDSDGKFTGGLHWSGGDFIKLTPAEWFNLVDKTDACIRELPVYKMYQGDRHMTSSCMKTPPAARTYIPTTALNISRRFRRPQQSVQLPKLRSLAVKLPPKLISASVAARFV